MVLLHHTHKDSSLNCILSLTVTVYVSTTDPRESLCLPRDVLAAAIQRSKAQALENYVKADELHKQIIDSGYRMIPVNHEEVLSRKYRISLSGIDAPESTMPYGKDAKEELTKLIQGKSLRVLVSDVDRCGRCVGEYILHCHICTGSDVKEGLGLALYLTYDKRPELEKWEKEPQSKMNWLVGSQKSWYAMGVEETET